MGGLTFGPSVSNLRGMFLKRGLTILFIFLFFGSPAHSTPMREFVMSCTYGVLAGTLVGAASLAFTKQPGENLHRVARGASLGLYAGIALGFYVVYGVPDENEDQEDPMVLYRKKHPKLALLPTLTERGRVDGAQLQYQVISF